MLLGNACCGLVWHKQSGSNYKKNKAKKPLTTHFFCYTLSEALKVYSPLSNLYTSQYQVMFTQATEVHI